MLAAVLAFRSPTVMISCGHVPVSAVIAPEMVETVGGTGVGVGGTVVIGVTNTLSARNACQSRSERYNEKS